jgi:hypothetical protein
MKRRGQRSERFPLVSSETSAVKRRARARGLGGEMIADEYADVLLPVGEGRMKS